MEFSGPVQGHDVDNLEVGNEDVLRNDSMMEEMKDCCTIFFLLPEEYDFDVDTLIQLWMAGEYIKDEHRGQECFHFLLDKGYLVRSCTLRRKVVYKINISRISDLLDGFNDNGSSCLKWGNDLQKKMQYAKIRHVSVVGNDVTDLMFQTLEQFKELRTLLFLHGYDHRVRQFPSNLFLCFRELQALDLSGTPIKELPPSVCHMIHLHYLDLSGTLIDSLPNILCSLIELQTLKLKRCSKLRGLPSELKRLTALRNLDVDVLSQVATMPSGIVALENLQTLSAFKVGTEDGCKIQELNKLNNLSGDFCIAMLENVGCPAEARDAALDQKRNIKRLQLRWTMSEKSDSYPILENLRPSSTLEELEIMCYSGWKFPSWVTDPGF